MVSYHVDSTGQCHRLGFPTLRWPRIKHEMLHADLLTECSRRRDAVASSSFFVYGVPTTDCALFSTVCADAVTPPEPSSLIIAEQESECFIVDAGGAVALVVLVVRCCGVMSISLSGWLAPSPRIRPFMLIDGEGVRIHTFQNLRHQLVSRRMERTCFLLYAIFCTPQVIFCQFC